MSSRTLRLRQPDLLEYLGRFPAVGLGLFCAGLLVFILFAWSVKSGGYLTRYDEPVIQGLHRWAVQHSNLIYQAARGGGFMGREFIALSFVVLLIYWGLKAHWREFGMLALGVGGGELWFETLSRLVDRHRPVFKDPFEVLTGPGFPSGHSMAAVIFYGLVAYLLLPYLPRRWRWLVVGAAVLMALIVGISRLYTGQHYPTDVLAGYAFGLAWGALVYTGIDWYWTRYPHP